MLARKKNWVNNFVVKETNWIEIRMAENYSWDARIAFVVRYMYGKLRCAPFSLSHCSRPHNWNIFYELRTFHISTKCWKILLFTIFLCSLARRFIVERFSIPVWVIWLRAPWFLAQLHTSRYEFHVEVLLDDDEKSLSGVWIKHQRPVYKKRHYSCSLKKCSEPFKKIAFSLLTHRHR